MISHQFCFFVVVCQWFLSHDNLCLTVLVGLTCLWNYMLIGGDAIVWWSISGSMICDGFNMWFNVTVIWLRCSVFWDIVAFVGPVPSSMLVSQTNPYTTGPFGISSWSADQSLTRSNMGGCWNQVSTPWDGYDVSLYPQLLLSCRSLSLRDLSIYPLFFPSVPLRRCMIDLHTTLTHDPGTFVQLWQHIL